MSKDELKAFREMAASFARRSVAPLLQNELPDGDLGRAAEVLAEAHDTGLMASPDPDAPGHEAGVWGVGALADGPRSSLALLEELAAACAGTAMAVHARGVACLALGMAGMTGPSRPALALMEGGFLPGAGTIADPSKDAPARIATVVTTKDGGAVIGGRKDFVWQAPDTDSYVVFGREGKEWAAFLIPAGAPGLKVEGLGTRMGLRACPIVNVVLDGAPAGQRLSFKRSGPEAVMELLRVWCLGLVAIGAGTGRGAIAAARVYAAERWQGCAHIIDHAGMGALLADAEAGTMVCRGLLEQAMAENGTARAGLLSAAKARLAGLPAAALAVTNSLQVFGGYGYMEDYRMEKRYRDVNTLKSAGGGARELRALIAALSREV